MFIIDGRSQLIYLFIYFQELKYLVKWEGFHQSDSSWEPESHLPAFVVKQLHSPKY